MFILRRKKDGLYWNNSGSARTNDWTDDLQRVTPFRTIQSARMARCFGYVPSRTQWGKQFAAERDELDKDFVENYAVIEVRLELV